MNLHGYMLGVFSGVFLMIALYGIHTFYLWLKERKRRIGK